MKQLLELYQTSPFFEVFETEHVEQLAANSQMRTFEEGDVIFRQGDMAAAFHMLVVGQIRLSFESDRTEHPEEEVLIQSITEPGRPLGWSALVPPFHYRATATADKNTQTLVLSRDFLNRYSEQHLDFGVAFRKRLLWVLGNRLRAARIRLVAKRYEREVFAIRALLSQSAGELSVTSPLHKLPHYLENRLTLADAFHCLDLLKVHGDPVERSLAEMCSSVMENVRKEVVLFRRLQTIYETIANAPENAPVAEIRERCCKDFVQLFEGLQFVIRGEEHLPERPGNIIVMNHLKNHTDNILPNDFVLTLDTHFVSAMILYKKYGHAPIRVIRRSRKDEYGHQRYYDRLGYIYVYRGHVDPAEDGDENVPPEERREMFLNTARGHLLAGRNVVICPEGTSVSTKESPVPFRTGAFRLAAYVRPEPLIVPIAVAHFDKKITRTKVAAVVYPPYRLSDFVPDPAAPHAIPKFAQEEFSRFQEYVKQAASLGGPLA